MIIYNQLLGSPICPDGCACDEYDCNTTHWKKNCGLTPGLCDMFKYSKSPIEYKVDWVRVYQYPDNTKQNFGCLTPERPTKRWIKAHEELYKNKHYVNSWLFESLMYNMMHVISAHFPGV